MDCPRAGDHCALAGEHVGGFAFGQVEEHLQVVRVRNVEQRVAGVDAVKRFHVTRDDHAVDRRGHVARPEIAAGALLGELRLL